MAKSKAREKIGDTAGCGGSREEDRAPTGKQLLYAQLRAEHPDWSKARCKQEAGYSRGTKSDKVENSQGYQDLAARIRKAQAEAGFSAKSCLRRMQTIIDRKGAQHDRDAIAAAKVGTEITGERMPEQVNVNILTDDEILANLIA
jgi:hypothetical protein